MEKRIQSSRTDSVAMFGKFLNQPKTIHRLFGRMMQDVEADK